jgi:hypothetical protein
MLMYALIGLSLVLVGVAGLQFAYLFYIDRVFRERQKYLHDLELRHSSIKARLAEAQARLAEQDRLLGDAYSSSEEWAEVIEER